MVLKILGSLGLGDNEKHVHDYRVPYYHFRKYLDIPCNSHQLYIQIMVQQVSTETQSTINSHVMFLDNKISVLTWSGDECQ